MAKPQATSKRFLAELELYVMLAIARLEEEAFGASIRREIQTRAGRDVAIGALYATLGRLERKGLIATSSPTPPAGRVGRPRKHCTLTAAGVQALQQSVARLNQMTRGMAFEAPGGESV